MGRYRSVAIAIAIVLLVVWGCLNLLIGFAFLVDAQWLIGLAFLGMSAIIFFGVLRPLIKYRPSSQ